MIANCVEAKRSARAWHHLDLAVDHVLRCRIRYLTVADEEFTNSMSKSQGLHSMSTSYLHVAWVAIVVWSWLWQRIVNCTFPAISWRRERGCFPLKLFTLLPHIVLHFCKLNKDAYATQLCNYVGGVIDVVSHNSFDKLRTWVMLCQIISR